MRLLDLVTPKDLSRVANLQLLAREVVEGLSSGRHRSPQKGFSSEFKEHRPYVAGDELRNIDWKAFAKSDRLYIREFEEETNLKCTLLVDQSGSMQYSGDRSGGQSKYDYAQVLAASIGYLLLSQQDAIGVVTFDNQPRTIVPPRSRPSHLTAVMTAIAQSASRRSTDLGEAIRKISPKLKRRGLLVLITDAMSDLESLGKSLAQLRGQKHEVLLFQILDPDEADFPFQGRIEFRDLENLGRREMVDANSVRQRYLAKYEQHQTQLRETCRRHRVDLVEVKTDRPVVEMLHEYLSQRRQRP
ncbi:hypothetical protein LF1_01280 [Rubripirellula obstinata]|uniref:VWFA domain-containing protein n=1 Tax=Rubripirellula obstinata TaxID=406547 RepID=A0A5B1CDJ1_9BACT|nr:DUF58 domain-containing protein [Rubripirellula obstinata]KAA1257640.1 hypothetical protein LF1_01280 [Rubripirellula obstinata]